MKITLKQINIEYYVYQKALVTLWFQDIRLGQGLLVFGGFFLQLPSFNGKYRFRTNHYCSRVDRDLLGRHPARREFGL